MAFVVHGAGLAVVTVGSTGALALAGGTHVVVGAGVVVVARAAAVGVGVVAGVGRSLQSLTEVVRRHLANFRAKPSHGDPNRIKCGVKHMICCTSVSAISD